MIEPAEVARAHRQQVGGRQRLYRLLFAVALFVLLCVGFSALDLIQPDDAIILPLIFLGLLYWALRKRKIDEPEVGK